MLPGADKFNMRQILSPLRRVLWRKGKEGKEKEKAKSVNREVNRRHSCSHFLVKKGASSSFYIPGRLAGQLPEPRKRRCMILEADGDTATG